LINYPKKVSIEINSGLSSRFPAIVPAFACLGYPFLSLAGQYGKSPTAENHYINKVVVAAFVDQPRRTPRNMKKNAKARE
jgi:hypothetical protein